jgi:hypothetical protein
MQYTIQVAGPCHESWDEMTPNDAGRHCAQCCKTVVDFTGWQQKDILEYVQGHGEVQVCGRFREEQLNTPINTDFIYSVTYSPLPLYKKIAAILLLAFGLIQMDNNVEAQTIGKPTSSVVTDTVKRNTHSHMIMGGIPVPRPVIKKTDNKHNPEYLKGEVAIKKTNTPVPGTSVGLVNMAPHVDTVRNKK